MRNLKKFLAVVLAIAILATTMVPALAAEAYTYEEAAEILYDLGLIAGDGVDFALGRQLTRAEGITIVLKLFGYQEEADTITDEEIDEALAGFADADLVKASWAKGWLAIGVREGLVSGTTDGRINPNGPFTGKQLAALILKMMGKELTLEMYNNACVELANIGGLGYAEVLFNDIQLNRDKAFGMMFAALNAKYDDGTTIIENLIYMGVVDEDKAAEYGLIEVAEIDKVEDVKVTVNVGEEPALPEEVEVIFSDGTTAKVPVTWGDVDTSEAGEYEVEGVLEGYDRIVIATVVVVEPELKVESVTADNLKQIVVKFNKELNGDTVTTDNLKLKKNNVTVSGYSVELQDDKKTVIITAGTKFENQEVYTLTVANVKDAAGAVIKTTTVEVRPFDATLPEVVGITFTGPRSFEIEFSEPIDSASSAPSITVKSGTTTVGVKSSFTYNSNKVTVDLYTDLADGKTYTITVKGFADYAGYKMINYSADLLYVADKSDIVATVEKAEQTYVVVKFNKPVKIDGVAKDFFYHTFSAWKPIDVYSDSDMTTPVSSSTAVDKVYVKFADGTEGYPIPEGTTTLVIRDTANDKKIKDNWGNEFLGATLVITVTADKTAPSVTELTVESERSLKVKFDEKVKFTKDNVEVLNADGSKNKDISITVSPSTPGKEFTIDLGTNKLTGKSIIVNIKNVEDTALAPNKLVSYTQTLTITDKTPPSVTKVTKKVNNEEQALYVFFDEEVGESALSKDSYYFVSGSTWKRISNTPEFYDGNKVVRIELTDDEKGYLATYGFVVMRVKDLADNELIAQTIENADIKEYDDPTNAPQVVSVKATSLTTVDIEFDQYLTEIDESAFKVNGAEPAGMSVSTNDKGNTVVTLTVKEGHEFTYDKSNGQVKIKTDDAKLANIFGVNVINTTIDAAGIEDKIAPVVAENGIETMDVDGDGKIDHIKVTFTEKMDYKYVSISNFEVVDYTVIDAYASTGGPSDDEQRDRTASIGNDETIYITVKEKASYDSDATPKVKIKGVLKDLAGNEYKVSDDALASVDKVAPKATIKHEAYSSTLNDKTKTTIVFSEKVSKFFVGINQSEGLYFTVNSDGTLTVKDKDNKVITNSIAEEPVTQFKNDGYARYVLGSDAVVIKFNKNTNTLEAAWSKTPTEVPEIFNSLILTATDTAGNVSGNLAVKP